MQKRIITLLCAVGLAISMPAFAAGLKLRPDAPARYVVQPGDTLWRISGRYLYSPWAVFGAQTATKSATRI
jgi:nucleoid-associated protein YgaU